MLGDLNLTYVHQVVGDVVDTFSPCMNMNVCVNGRHIINGCTIKPSMASEAPRIQFEGQADHLYTLLLTDPDMPSPSNPTLREYIHWIVTDIPGSGTINQGNEILPYTAPTPLLGIHRYILMMFEQVTPLGLLQPPVTRAHFNSKAFALRYQLGVPKAIAYFVAKKEPSQGR